MLVPTIPRSASRPTSSNRAVALTNVLLVIGMNSIAAYVLADGFAGFISGSFYIHLGKDFDMVLGPAYASLVKGGLVLLVEWYILYWMYRRKLFLKI